MHMRAVEHTLRRGLCTHHAAWVNHTENRCNPLIGTWRLLSWEIRSVEDGQVTYPLGKDATDYIMYNEDGYMFVAIMAPHRLRFVADDLLSATKEEEAQAEEA